MTDVEIAQRLVAQLGSRLVASLTTRKAEIVASLPLLTRPAVRGCWGSLMGWVPIVAEAGLEAILDEFGDLSARDLLRFFATRAHSKGRAREGAALSKALASLPPT